MHVEIVLKNEKRISTYLLRASLQQWTLRSQPARLFALPSTRIKSHSHAPSPYRPILKHSNTDSTTNSRPFFLVDANGVELTYYGN